MKTICIIADTHGKHREVTIPKCDILIHCGDLCNMSDGSIELLEDIDRWFGEADAGEVLCIGGNHDKVLQNSNFSFQNATILEDTLVEIDGIKIYGSPWCPDLMGFAYYKDEGGLKEAWRAIPSGIDILVTHTPPFGALDLPSSRTMNLGCAILSKELKRIQPKYHVFGHIHASHDRLLQDGTHFINAAIVGGRYFEVRNNPTLIEYEV